MLSLGFLFVVINAYILFSSPDINDWVELPATITSVGKYERVVESQTNVVVNYGLTVEYVYEFNFEKYSSIDNVETRSYSMFNNLKNLYVIDGEISIYVNPQNPKQAIFEKKGLGIIYMLVVFGVFLILLGLVTIISNNKHYKK